MKWMPIQYIGMLLCTGLLLFSGCTREETFEGPGNGGGSVLEGEGFLSLGFHTGDLSALTRSETPGTAAEQQVNAVRVVLYDKPEDDSDPTVQYVFHYNISTNPTPGDNNDHFIGDGLYINGAYFGSPALHNGAIDATQFVTYAQGIVRQNYQMLVIINPTYEASTTPGSNTLTVTQMETGSEAKSPIDVYWRTRKGQPLSLMTNADIDANHLVALSQTDISGYGGIADNNGTGNFLMTNVQDLIQIVNTDIPTSKADAHANPFEITVDRMVAKVIVQKEDDNNEVTVPSGASIYDVVYLLDRQNKYSYWWRSLAYLKGRSTWDSNGDVFEEPGDNSTRDERYAFTPNFAELLNEWKYAQNYYFYEPGSADSNLPESDFNTLPGPGTAVGQYVLENTLIPERYSFGEDYYTRVLVRANYCPAGIVKGESYYVFNGKAISQTQMNTYRTTVEQKAIDLGAITGSSGNYTPVDGVFPYTSADEPAGMSGFYYAIFMVEYYGLKAPATGSNALSGSRTESFDTSVGYGIGYYYKGINYYAAPIRHFDFSDGSVDNPGPATYGYYGVVRNNVYTVTIRSINGPGASTPTGSSYISAGVNIQPWGYAGKNIELGQEAPVMTYVTYKYYISDGDTKTLIKTDYDINMAVGATIPVTSLEILNKYKAFANSLDSENYGNGVVFTYPANSAVSVNPEQNVVEIEYPKEGFHSIKITYFFEDRDEHDVDVNRMSTRAENFYEYVTLPAVERGTRIDFDFLAEHAGFSIRKTPAGSNFLFTYSDHYCYDYGNNYSLQLPITSLEGDLELSINYKFNSKNPGVQYVYFYEGEGSDIPFVSQNIKVGTGDNIPLDGVILNEFLTELNIMGLGSFQSGVVKRTPAYPTVSADYRDNYVEIRYPKATGSQTYTVTLHYWDIKANDNLIDPITISGVLYGELFSEHYMTVLSNTTYPDIWQSTIEKGEKSYELIYYDNYETLSCSVSQGAGTGTPVVFGGVSYSQMPVPIPGNDVHIYLHYADTWMEVSYLDTFGERLNFLPGGKNSKVIFDVIEGDIIDENTEDIVLDFSTYGYEFKEAEFPYTIVTGRNPLYLHYGEPWIGSKVYLVDDGGNILGTAGTYTTGSNIVLSDIAASLSSYLPNGPNGNPYVVYTTGHWGGYVYLNWAKDGAVSFKEKISTNSVVVTEKMDHIAIIVTCDY